MHSGKRKAYWLTCLVCSAGLTVRAGEQVDGYRGLWYFNQAVPGPYKYKYSGGLGTYPQQMVPQAIYSKEANKTFFCYGGRGGNKRQLLDMISYYDHASGMVPRPAAVLARETNDTHYNPSLALDEKGYVYVFCNSHGTGYELDKTDPTHGQAFIYRSDKPYSIDGFSRVLTENFSYSQPWWLPGRGLLWLHARYKGNVRRLFWATSKDGKEFSQAQPLAHMEPGQGHYQISWCRGQRVATAMDLHPKSGGLNARTNIYYLETTNAGQTWHTADGRVVPMPLTAIGNPALVHDYRKEGLLVYLKDLDFDAVGHPLILYLTSKGWQPGPENGPHQWYTARWTGSAWEVCPFTTSDHNYDHGSLYLEADSTWRIISPTEPGPQAFATGGQITVYVSQDQGAHWKLIQKFPITNGRNQTYVRKPLNAHADFYAFWADGNAFEPSDSDLYFASRSGQIFRLKMTGKFAKPEAVAP